MRLRKEGREKETQETGGPCLGGGEAGQVSLLLIPKGRVEAAGNNHFDCFNFMCVIYNICSTENRLFLTIPAGS